MSKVLQFRFEQEILAQTGSTSLKALSIRIKVNPADVYGMVRGTQRITDGFIKRLAATFPDLPENFERRLKLRRTLWSKTRISGKAKSPLLKLLLAETKTYDLPKLARSLKYAEDYLRQVAAGTRFASRKFIAAFSTKYPGASEDCLQQLRDRQRKTRAPREPHIVPQVTEIGRLVLRETGLPNVRALALKLGLHEITLLHQFAGIKRLSLEFFEKYAEHFPEAHSRSIEAIRDITDRNARTRMKHTDPVLRFYELAVLPGLLRPYSDEMLARFAGGAFYVRPEFSNWLRRRYPKLSPEMLAVLEKSPRPAGLLRR